MPIHVDAYVPPAWLREALRLASESKTFGDGGRAPTAGGNFSRRCREAAGVAFSIAELRKERQRIGFVPLSLADYIQGLVKVTRADLSSVLSWFGVADLLRPTEESALALARLTRSLGIGLREALIHIRISLAGRGDAAPVPLLVARHRAGDGAGEQIEDYEAVLSQIEAEYDLVRLRELRRTEARVRSAYDE